MSAMRVAGLVAAAALAGAAAAQGAGGEPRTLEQQRQDRARCALQQEQLVEACRAAFRDAGAGPAGQGVCSRVGVSWFQDCFEVTDGGLVERSSPGATAAARLDWSKHPQCQARAALAAGLCSDERDEASPQVLEACLDLGWFVAGSCDRTLSPAAGEPRYPAAGYTRPATTPGCVQQALAAEQQRLPAERSPLISVRFAVGADGTPSRFTMLTPRVPASVAAEVWRAIQSCRWTPGGWPGLPPEATWVIMPIG
ncbi:MAG: hypothetical protein QM767_23945 [Anaeromyxobacter sp.]